jgi:hypothetical protein
MAERPFANGVPGHVVSMTLERPSPFAMVESVGTCQCGWRHRAKYDERGSHARMDAAIEAHWRDVAPPAEGVA